MFHSSYRLIALSFTYGWVWLSYPIDCHTSKRIFLLQVRTRATSTTGTRAATLRKTCERPPSQPTPIEAATASAATTDVVWPPASSEPTISLDYPHSQCAPDNDIHSSFHRLRRSQSVLLHVNSGWQGHIWPEAISSRVMRRTEQSVITNLFSSYGSSSHSYVLC